MSEVRSGGQEELSCIRGQGQWPRGASPFLRSVAAGRRYPASEVRAVTRRNYTASKASGGREETPCIRGQGRLGGATLCPRPGAVTLRSHPKPEARACGREEQPEERWLSRHRRA